MALISPLKCLSFHFRWHISYANMADMLMYDISLAVSVISEMKVYATRRKFTRWYNFRQILFTCKQRVTPTQHSFHIHTPNTTNTTFSLQESPHTQSNLTHALPQTQHNILSTFTHPTHSTQQSFHIHTTNTPITTFSPHSHTLIQLIPSQSAFTFSREHG